MQTRLSLFTVALGLVLMAFTVATESEPGAIPLLLVVVGVSWLAITRARARHVTKDLTGTADD